MSLWIRFLTLLGVIIIVVTAGRKDDRFYLSELFLQPRQNEPCGKRSSSDYCPDDEFDDKFLEYYQNNEKSSDYEMKDEQKRNQISGILDELKNANKKRTGIASQTSCDCLIKYGVIDLGYAHSPRYLISAVCEGEEESRPHQHKCWRGSRCKPVEYKVKVLTRRGQTDILENDITASQLPDSLRTNWKFKTVTITTGCYCSF